ncbi:DUF5615 family PIN-like protein [Sphingomonas koreensis]|uniref:DUF5615 family PIN-like protein n=1 Tax=Sphingomonas koreensis TaxID=93064 RepID=UPI0013DEB970|nr:DUF5615 family PIN-like protein [Sphingomonas koreensis]
MRFLTDQNIPDSVGDMLIEHGHEVTRLRDVAAPDAPDELVAAVAEQQEMILVTADDDFDRKVAPRIPRGYKARFKRLSRITMRCNFPQIRGRLELFLPLIDSELNIALQNRDRRLRMAIGNDAVWINR